MSRLDEIDDVPATSIADELALERRRREDGSSPRGIPIAETVREAGEQQRIDYERLKQLEADYQAKQRSGKVEVDLPLSSVRPPASSIGQVITSTPNGIAGSGKVSRITDRDYRLRSGQHRTPRANMKLSTATAATGRIWICAWARSMPWLRNFPRRRCCCKWIARTAPERI